MATGFNRKQPDERYALTFNFVDNVLASGESVSSYTVEVTDEDSTDVTSTIVASDSQSGGIVTVVVQGGTDGKRYTITVVVDTDASYVYEMDAVLEVLEQI